jgi:hypothetical protein
VKNASFRFRGFAGNQVMFEQGLETLNTGGGLGRGTRSRIRLEPASSEPGHTAGIRPSDYCCNGCPISHNTSDDNTDHPSDRDKVRHLAEY